MLRSFRFANHKSFRNEAELLLMPAYNRSRPVIPVAGVFGANASGKSNLLDALEWMRRAVRESYAKWEPDSGVPRTPFRLDPAARIAPSLYSVEVVLDGQRYTYGLEVDDKLVTEEWLYTYPRNRRRVVFERGRNGVRLGSTVVDYRVRGEQLARQTRDNALFLSVAAHNDLDEVGPVYGWFRSQVHAADATGAPSEELLNRLRDPRQRSSLVPLLRAADLGISAITSDSDGTRDALDKAVRSAIDNETLQLMLESMPDSSMPDSGLRELARALLRAENPLSDQLLNSFREQLAKLIADRLRLGQPGLRLYHGASRVPLSLEDQSAGTRSWIGLVSVALDAIDSGGLMLVDEIDASLHPHLTARLIGLFKDSAVSSRGAQLLFTTHDATLLGDETLSRDEIWFVEKDLDSGATRLYPLTDFHPRKNENLEGRYLAGGYGAIPVLSETEFQEAIRTGRSDEDAAA